MFVLVHILTYKHVFPGLQVEANIVLEKGSVIAPVILM